jgi:hypothetical protein
VTTQPRISKSLTLITSCILAIAGMCFSLAHTANAQSQLPPASTAAAFEKMKSLAGTWEADSPKGKITTTFQVTSGGTALLESMSSPADGEMVTVYHLDGVRLMLTHYCHSGNQPRMEASSFDPKTNQIDFAFLDVTNLASSNDGHMHQAVIMFDNPDQFTEKWTFYVNGKPAMTVPITYHRAS